MSDPMLLIALAGLALALGQLVKGITGFGSALVSVLLLNWLMPPAEAIFLSACIDLLGGAILLTQVRRSLKWRLVLAIFVPLVIGQFLGTGLLVRLPVDVLKILVGAFVALMGLRWVITPIRAGQGELEALPDPPGPILAQAAVAGALGGLFGGLVGASGPPIILYMKHHFDDAFVRSTLIGSFFLGALTLIILLVLREATPSETLQVLPWVIPPAILGNLLGSKLSNKVPRAAFARLVGALLLTSGVGLVLRALIA